MRFQRIFDEPLQLAFDAQMKNEPVLIRRFSLNQKALRVQEFLQKKGVNAFIFMDATWSGKGETQQGIRLVVKPVDADRAFALLNEYDTDTPEPVVFKRDSSRFYTQMAWLVSILFAFLLGSILSDKVIDATEVIVGIVFLSAAGYFFFAANMQKKKSGRLNEVST